MYRQYNYNHPPRHTGNLEGYGNFWRVSRRNTVTPSNRPKITFELFQAGITAEIRYRYFFKWNHSLRSFGEACHNKQDSHWYGDKMFVDSTYEDEILLDFFLTDNKTIRFNTLVLLEIE